MVRETSRNIPDLIWLYDEMFVKYSSHFWKILEIINAIYQKFFREKYLKLKMNMRAICLVLFGLAVSHVQTARPDNVLCNFIVINKKKKKGY